MEFMKTIREFHWLTMSVILLTAFVFVLMMIAVVAGLLGLTDLTSGLAQFVIYLTSLLVYVFPIILIIIIIGIIIAAIKAWFEKYLDAVLQKLDLLATQKAEREVAGTELAVMNGKVERMEKKLDKIEHILEKVGE